jgi:sphingomyelin phosphodiesterase 2
VSGEQVTVMSLNTLGVGPGLAGRYAVIGAEVEAGDADVACFQEVISWWHLRQLARRMCSFGQVSYRAAPPGPAGGLVTFSRRPVSGTVYRRFGLPPRADRISRRARLAGAMKGVLVTRLAGPGLCVVNTHPMSNRDGDWSRTGRYYPLHKAQLDALARVVLAVSGPAVVCGDFNVDRGSSLFGDFVAGAGLADAFGGRCPATYRAEYLPAGETPHCIDFILTSQGVTAEAATVLFAGKVPLPGGPGYVSDHLGLCARLSLAPP